MSSECSVIWQRVREKAGPFPPAAFEFVQVGLRHTVETIAAMAGADASTSQTPDPEAGPNGERHISGEELCLGLRDFAIKQFGLMARTVLESWHIRTTDDFGKIVFALVEVGVLRKTEEDSLGDFESVYDFDEAFATDMLGNEHRPAR